MNRFVSAMLTAGVLVLGVAASSPAAGTVTGFGAKVAIDSMDVSVRIRDGIAVTDTTLVLRNTEKRLVEGEYRFPLPEGVALSDLTLWVAGKEVGGETVERQQARGVYDSYKPARRDPALLRQLDDGIYGLAVYPIAAHATRKVRFRYVQTLPTRAGTSPYVYRLAMPSSLRDGRRVFWRVGGEEAGQFRMTITAEPAPGETVALCSPSHAKLFDVDVERTSRARSTMTASPMSLKRDIVMEVRGPKPKPGMTLLASRVAGEDGYFLLRVTVGDAFRPKPVPRDYVVLVDTSGSMRFGQRTHLARRLAEKIVTQATPKDHLHVLAFGRAIAPLARGEGSRGQALSNQLQSALKAHAPEGTTAFERAIAYARKLPRRHHSLRLVLLTDGDVDPWERPGLFHLGRELSRRSVSLYVGLIQSDTDTRVLSDLAKTSGGRTVCFDGENEFAARLDELAEAAFSLASGPTRLGFSRAGAYDVCPANMPNVRPGQTLTVTGRYSRAGQWPVTLSSGPGPVHVQQWSNVTFPAEDRTHPNVARLWAWRKARAMLRQAAEEAPSPDRTRSLWQVAELGLAHTLVTPYTSLLVLENEDEFRRWGVPRVARLRQRWQASGTKADRAAFLAARQEALNAIQTRKALGPPNSPVPLLRPFTPRGGAVSHGRGVKLQLPKPMFCGTPKSIRIRPLRPAKAPRPPIVAPEGVRLRNVAFRRPVTGSDEEPIIGELSYVTDGDKTGADGSFVELGPGTQWVQIDLGASYWVYGLAFWHYHREARVYKDVIVQVSNDPHFVKGVKTLFNNDLDNSSGLGIGRDWQYVDDYRGEVIARKEPVLGRYVRLYSNGNTSNDLNHYTEVEVYGTLEK